MNPTVQTPAAVRPALGPRFDAPDAPEFAFTPPAWEAFISSDAAVGADRIHWLAGDLADAIERWVERFGDADDPGIAALIAAGLPLPPPVQEYGTMMKGLAEDIRGLGWALRAFDKLNHDRIPDTAVTRGRTARADGGAAAAFGVDSAGA